MTEIGYQAFIGCTALTKIDLSHIKTIYGAAFKNSGIKDVDISNVETIYGDAFNGCSNLEEIRLPKLKGTLENNTFVGSSITRVLDLGSVSIIGTGTNGYNWGPFKRCKSLLEVILPATVTSIGWGTFSDCPSLRFVKILALIPPTLNEAVFDNSNNCPIYVPTGSVTAYKSATNWSNYASRIQAIVD